MQTPSIWHPRYISLSLCGCAETRVCVCIFIYILRLNGCQLFESIVHFFRLLLLLLSRSRKDDFNIRYLSFNRIHRSVFLRSACFCQFRYAVAYNINCKRTMCAVYIADNVLYYEFRISFQIISIHWMYWIGSWVWCDKIIQSHAQTKSSLNFTLFTNWKKKTEFGSICFTIGMIYKATFTYIPKSDLSGEKKTQECCFLAIYLVAIWRNATKHVELYRLMLVSWCKRKLTKISNLADTINKSCRFLSVIFKIPYFSCILNNFGS